MNNYVVCGKLTIEGDIIVNGTVFNVKSLGGLVKVLEQGSFKNIMEFTNNETVIKQLTLDNLVLVDFECSDKSELTISGSCTCIDTKTIE